MSWFFRFLRKDQHAVSGDMVSREAKAMSNSPIVCIITGWHEFAYRTMATGEVSILGIDDTNTNSER